MRKKLTITVDEQVYQALHSLVGQGNISSFINSLIRPHVMKPDLESAYHQMSAEESREAEALEWAEATIGDVQDEAR